ncbi:MAG: site-specific integrase [Desulforhopalus sp.]
MSVHQHKDGRWICRYRKGKDPDRPNSTARYFGRGGEGEWAAHRFNDQLGLGIRRTETSPTFVELVNDYMTAKKPSMANSGYENMAIKMRGVILPELGNLMAHHLTPSRMDKYVSTRVKTVKTTTVHRELSDIRAVLLWAVGRKLIANNPMLGFEMPTRDDAIISPPSKPEFDAILSCAVPHLKRAMMISRYTGLRPGKEELLYLKWDAVDFHNKTLTVISAVKGGLPLRMVPLNKTILEHMEQWFDEDLLKEMRYLIHYNGGPVASLKTAWKMAKKRARVTRKIRMYDLRHAFITTLLERGADLKSVSEIVGHSSPDITARVYQHVSNKLKRSAVDLLD